MGYPALPKSEDLLRYGSIVRADNFSTLMGLFTIRLIWYEGKLYFHKMWDGSVAEIQKLT